MGTFTENPYCSPIIRKQLDRIRYLVTKKDRDFVACYDGEEGVGKSVLAMQHAKILDPEFNIDKVVFNADDFIKLVKDPDLPKGSCIVLDETFSAASARASLSSINRAMIGVATEMRQKNLFVLLVLPSFFDLDRYFALWRCRILIHIFFDKNDERAYIVFDKRTKKLLYLMGKKTYDYSKPKSPFPPARFNNEYVIAETEYRKKKANAFNTRKVSARAQRWMEQRNAFIRELYYSHHLTEQQISLICTKQGAPAIARTTISEILVKTAEIRDDLIVSPRKTPASDDMSANIITTRRGTD